MKRKELAAASIVFIVSSFIATGILAGYAEQPTVSLKTYSIRPIPFSGYEATSDTAKIPIIFSEYGKLVKVIYPAPKSAIIQDQALIIKNCKEFFLKNVDKIIEIETQNPNVKDYLTAESKISLPTKEIFLSILTSPREKIVQRNAAMGKNIAEFRSKEFDIDEHTKFCIYVTFICNPENASVEGMIISAVKLESE